MAPITGARDPVYAHSKGRELSWLRDQSPEPRVNLHPDDAAARGIGEGDMVRVETPHGSFTMRAHATYMALKGMVDAPHGWAMVPGANVNDATPREFDPISGYPSFKALLCDVERVDAR